MLALTTFPLEETEFKCSDHIYSEYQTDDFQIFIVFFYLLNHIKS